jgi:hypothetical protein
VKKLGTVKQVDIMLTDLMVCKSLLPIEMILSKELAAKGYKIPGHLMMWAGFREMSQEARKKNWFKALESIGVNTVVIRDEVDHRVYSFIFEADPV